MFINQGKYMYPLTAPEITAMVIPKPLDVNFCKLILLVAHEFDVPPRDITGHPPTLPKVVACYLEVMVLGNDLAKTAIKYRTNKHYLREQFKQLTKDADLMRKNWFHPDTVLKRFIKVRDPELMEEIKQHHPQLIEVVSKSLKLKMKINEQRRD